MDEKYNNSKIETKAADSSSGSYALISRQHSCQ